MLSFPVESRSACVCNGKKNMDDFPLSLLDEYQVEERSTIVHRFKTTYVINNIQTFPHGHERSLTTVNILSTVYLF